MDMMNYRCGGVIVIFQGAFYIHYNTGKVGSKIMCHLAWCPYLNSGGPRITGVPLYKLVQPCSHLLQPFYTIIQACTNL